MKTSDISAARKLAFHVAKDTVWQAFCYSGRSSLGKQSMQDELPRFTGILATVLQKRRNIEEGVATSALAAAIRKATDRKKGRDVGRKHRRTGSFPLVDINQDDGSVGDNTQMVIGSEGGREERRESVDSPCPDSEADFE